MFPVVRFKSVISTITVILAFAAQTASAAPVANLSLASKPGSEYIFTKTQLSCKAGQTVKLTFANNSSKDSGLQHNWVLVNPGKLDSVGQAGIMAGPDKGYIPDSADILAHTKLLNSGEKDTITFTAPAKAGDYPYLCTFPGHSSMMKGILTVH